MNSTDWAGWIGQQRQRLSGQPLHGYQASEPPMAEPVAMSALTCTAHGWREPAESACRALLAAQQTTGSVPVRLDADGPHWTTSLACLAWRRFEIAWPERSRPWCSDAYLRGIDFLLGFGGEKIDPSENVGHNTQLVGWPWVAGTHSWLEPTALALMALRHCGHSRHPRALEAAELLIDRLLPDGGANYGNTFVLGQVLRPHVLPSAMCMVALHRLEPELPALAPTQTYLRSELVTGQPAALSLAWTMHAMVSAEWDAAEAGAPGLDHFNDSLQAALSRLQANPTNPHRLNMLLLATSLRASPLLDMEPFTMQPAEGNPQKATRRRQANMNKRPAHPSRRKFLLTGSAVVAATGAAAYYHHCAQGQSEVFIARNQKYGGELVATIRDGLLACEFDPQQVRGKRVLLKPNLVEPSRQAPHMTTHPAVIQAAAEVFRGWQAEVSVGEGPGHVRDTEQALVDSGVYEALSDSRLIFEDLNYQEIRAVKNAGRSCKLAEFYFPRAVIEADLVVSLPKLKTHHWMGMTGAMKNLYGVIPGIKYGWPKNVLHFNGIPETVFDINASVGRTLTIVDGIDCMEGDGPILGTPKHMGLIIVGQNLTAVDATLARLMDIIRERIPYLALAAGRLGPIDDQHIVQRGEAWEPLTEPFLMLDRDHLRKLRDAQTHWVT